MFTPPKTSPVSETWLQRGQALETRGDFNGAIAAYDRAIAGSRDDPRLHGLAWMNRGNALQKLAAHSEGDQRALLCSSAVDAYDRAIARFAELPSGEPVFCNHLGAAWLNRGHALLSADNFSGAVDSFHHAIVRLESLPLAANPHYRLNLAGARANLAHALLDSDPAGARAFAGEALAVLDGLDRTHAAFAEMSLRARRALVMALGRLLRAGVSADPSCVNEATDIIDDGLALAREWETHGHVALRPLAARLFRLGAQLYRVHQPHFLAEFVLENLADGSLASDAEFQAAAAEALALALAELKKPQLLVAGDAASVRQLETARALRDALSRLSSPGPHLPT